MTHTLWGNQQLVHNPSPLCQNGDATPRQDGSRWSRHLFLSLLYSSCWLLVRVLGLINLIDAVVASL